MKDNYNYKKILSEGHFPCCHISISISYINTALSQSAFRIHKYYIVNWHINRYQPTHEDLSNNNAEINDC